LDDGATGALKQCKYHPYIAQMFSSKIKKLYCYLEFKSLMQIIPLITERQSEKLEKFELNGCFTMHHQVTNKRITQIELSLG